MAERKVGRAEMRGDYMNAIQPYINSRMSQQNIKRLCQLMFRVPNKEMLRINLNGTVFILPRYVCSQIPTVDEEIKLRESSIKNGSRLQGLWLRLTKRSNEFCYARNASVFAAVVDYVQNHELHAPKHICPRFFALEINFWGLDIDMLESCCFPLVTHFLYEQERLGKFHDFIRRTTAVALSSSSNFDFTSRISWFRVLRDGMWKVLDEPFSSSIAKVYFYYICLILLLSFTTIAVSTLDLNNERFDQYLVVSEYICLGFLYLDYILRVVFYPVPQRFFCDFINVTDGLATVSSVANEVANQTGYEDVYMEKAINMMQILRILRLLRPMSKVMGFRLMYYTLRSSFRELLLVLMLLVFLTIVFSSLLYYLGDRESIHSIPEGMWFAVICMTTVGFGDVVPTDAISMIIGCVMAVCGIIMMSMITPIMVSNFHSLYINAVVGQPSTLKKAFKVLGNDLDGTSSSTLVKGLQYEENMPSPRPRKQTPVPRRSKSHTHEEVGGNDLSGIRKSTKRRRRRIIHICRFLCCCHRPSHKQGVKIKVRPAPTVAQRNWSDDDEDTSDPANDIVTCGASCSHTNLGVCAAAKAAAAAADTSSTRRNFSTIVGSALSKGGPGTTLSHAMETLHSTDPMPDDPRKT